MFKFWDLAVMSLCMQFLMSFLWVPLAAYAHSLGWHSAFLSKAFALCVGCRFAPNALVVRLGAPTELGMVGCVSLGYVVALLWPTERWALFTLAAGSGMFFPRACVALHMKAVTNGDIDDLSLAAKRCASARALASVLNYTLIPCVYMKCGWTGVCCLALCFSTVYLLLSLKLNVFGPCSKAHAAGACSKMMEDHRGSTCNDGLPKKRKIMWIDWAMSALFVSTELQTNTFASVMPTILMERFSLSPWRAGFCLAACYCCAMVYLSSLSWLPKILNPPRPVNLVWAYFAIAVSGLLMAAACKLSLMAGLAMIILGAILFTTAVQVAQTIMQECMTAVMTLPDASWVMGFSEVFGCFVGIVGSYSGQMSLSVAAWAPFMLMAAGAVASWLMLLVSLAVRAKERTKRGIYFNEWEEQQSTPKILLALLGLDEVFHGRRQRRTVSYITAELSCRSDPDHEPICDATATTP